MLLPVAASAQGGLSLARFHPDEDRGELLAGGPGLRDRGSGPVDHLYECSTPAETAMTLKAVGNLHDPALADQVVYFLDSASAPVRACAAQALGALGDVSKRELLTGLLPEERFGAVRSAMTDALRELPASPHSLRTVLGLVRREPHNEARALMVSYLVDHLHDFEQARATLREMTASDPSNEVRLLASISLRPPR